MREMESIAFVIPGVLKRGGKLKERRWEKSFNNDIIERIWCWGILRARKRVFLNEDKRIMALFLVHVLPCIVCIRRRTHRASTCRLSYSVI